MTLSWLRGRSLLRQLVIGVCGVVSAAVMGIGAMAILGLRDEVVTLSDNQVAHSLAAFDYWYAGHGSDVGETGITGYPGQAPGTVIALMRGQSPVLTAVFSDGETVSATDAVARAFASIGWRDNRPQTVRLADLGSHRVGVRDLGGGDRLVSAVSLEEANRALARNSLIVVGLVMLALLALTLVLLFKLLTVTLPMAWMLVLLIRLFTSATPVVFNVAVVMLLLLITSLR